DNNWNEQNCMGPAQELVLDFLPRNFHVSRKVARKMKVITSEELKTQHTRNINPCYFKFRKFEIISSRRVVVDFGLYRGWNGNYSAYGGTWVFRKVHKRWVFTPTNG